ncbi:MAG: DsbA family protein [Gammaproteobacteria bacterium]
MQKIVRHYFDYKSPYAYLAQAANQALAAVPGVTVECLPYTLQIGKYLGEASLDDAGNDILGTRNDHQWRRVRYAYRDCRREANRRGLVIRGPRKIFDSSLAHIAFLFVREQGDPRPFHDACFERFWRRELDLEAIAALTALMVETGFDAAAFEAYANGAGRVVHDRIQHEAEAQGVFGVPSWLVDGDLYWGLERLERVYEKLSTG